MTLQVVVRGSKTMSNIILKANILATRSCLIIKTAKQAGTELGQAQLKLELDFTLNIYRFGFLGSVLVDLCRWI